MLFTLALFSLPALAVPGQFTHQGRLLDDAGIPLEGDQTITFRLMDSEDDGAEVWSEALSVRLTNGFYAAVLGQDEDDNPLDLSVLEQAPLWLELTLAGEDPMTPRSPVHSVPYAQMAGISEELTGGQVDATEVAVAGTTVIDEDGRWVGSPMQWDDIAGIPAGFADGEDDDTVTTDTVLSAAEVVAHVEGADIDLGGGSTLAGLSIATLDDTLAATDCLEGDLLRRDSATESWACSTDLAPGTTVGGEEMLTAASGSAVPTGMIAFFASSLCPTGWSEFTELQGRFILGTPSGGTSGDTVGSAMSAGGNLTTSGVVAHTHSASPPDGSTDSATLTHDHGMSHNHMVDAPSTTTDSVSTGGSSGCTTVTDKWNNSGGCHWPASCSSGTTVASCGSGGGTPHEHTVDLPSFPSEEASSVTTDIETQTHSHTVETPSFMTDASGADAIDITPPYLQLLACVAP